MNFIHAREYLEEGDVIVVNCDTQCNVRIMDDPNFESFRKQERHHCYGGHYRMFPARIAVPRTGYWNVTLDVGGGSAQIRYGISYIKRDAQDLDGG